MDQINEYIQMKYKQIDTLTGSNMNKFGEKYTSYNYRKCDNNDFENDSDF